MIKSIRQVRRRNAISEKLRAGVVVLLLEALITSVAPSAIIADPIVIIQTRDLQFGVLERDDGSKNIDFTDKAAGQFSITGNAGMPVRITIVSASLASTGATMELDLKASNIAYSQDGGVTWKTFSNANLVQETRFPESPGNATSTIMLRIGGRLSIAQNQRRGAYQASLTVIAGYIE